MIESTSKGHSARVGTEGECASRRHLVSLSADDEQQHNTGAEETSFNETGDDRAGDQKAVQGQHGFEFHLDVGGQAIGLPAK